MKTRKKALEKIKGLKRLLRKNRRRSQKHETPFQPSDQNIAELRIAQRQLLETRKRAEHLNAVLYAIRKVGRLLHTETDPKRLIERSCEYLTEALGYRSAWIVLTDKTGARVKATASAGIEGGFALMEKHFREGAFPVCVKRSLRKHELVVVQDPESECPDCPLACGYRGQSGFTSSLASDGRVYGVLSVSVPGQYAQDEQERELFGTLAEDLGFALRKIDTEEQVRLQNGIIRTLPHPMAFVSREYRYLAINDIYAEFFGVATEKIIGLSAAELFERELFESEIKPNMSRCLAGEAVVYEILVDFKRKGPCWMEMSYFPFKNETGEIVGLVSHGFDIDARKRIEQKLKENERKYRLLAENSADVIWTADRDFRFTFLSPSVKKIFGYDPEEIIGLDIFSSLPEEERAKAKQKALEMRDCGDGMDTNDETVGMELVQFKRDGTRFWTEVLFKPFLDECGEVVGYLGATRDIEDRKKAERQIRQLKRTESLGRMAGAIAHNFNNILTVAVGNLEMAIEDLTLGLDVGQYLMDSQAAVLRASELSRLMLTYLGHGPVKIEPLRLSKVCRDCLEQLRPTMPETVRMSTEFPDPGPVVMADRGQFEKIMKELIANSCEALAHNNLKQKTSGKISVSVSTVPTRRIESENRFPVDWTATDDNYACISVADDGQGIEAESMGGIFDPFFTDKFAGRGLGLATVIGIVKAHSGCVSVKSWPGKGSVFLVYLPLTPAEKL